MSKMSNIHVVAQEAYDFLRRIYTLDEIYDSPALVLHIDAFISDEDKPNLPLIKEAVRDLAYETMKHSLSYNVW